MEEKGAPNLQVYLAVPLSYFPTLENHKQNKGSFFPGNKLLFKL